MGRSPRTVRPRSASRSRGPGRARRTALLLSVGLVGLLGVAGGGTAAAGTVIPSVPGTNPVDHTPRVVDDAVVPEAGVRELRQVGSTMFVGGKFRTVLNASRTTTYQRYNLFSFDAATGAMTSWAPYTDASVYAFEASPDGRFLYIGGSFGNFAGNQVHRLVKYDLVNRRVDLTFRFPVAASRVSDLQLVGGRLWVSGDLPGGVVAVDPVTGARSGYLDKVKAAGTESGWPTGVYRFAVNPARTKAVLIGSFTSIGGVARQQIAMVNLGTGSATLSPWYSSRWDEDCATTLQWYTRDVDWLPSGSAFVVVTTGAGFPGTPKLCDTATRWSAVDAGGQQPTWINYSGGDTFHSVAATDRGIFVSGHFRWLDNPQGRDTMGPGAVVRRGIGSLDPTTGRATSWNPTKSVEGGLGAFDLYFTARGLWVGHFERYLGQNSAGPELREGLGLLPF